MSTLRDVLRRLIDSGVTPDTAPVEARHIRVTNIVALLGAISIGAWVPMVAAAGHVVSVIENSVATLGYLCVLPLERRGRHTVAVSLTLGLALFQIGWSTVLFGAASASPLFFVALITVPYLMYHRRQRRLAIAFSMAAALCAVASVALWEQLPLRLPIGDPRFQTLFNTVVAVGVVVVGTAAFAHTVDRSEDALTAAHARAEALLLNVLPPSIAHRLQSRPDAAIVDRFESVTVLFADIVGFTALSAREAPERTVELLNTIFGRFDAICDAAGVDKIKTIGDGYMAVAGAPVPDPDHAVRLAEVAVAMRDWMATDPTGEGLELRIGLNTGEAVGGIVGTSRFHYDLWSDAVNVASRMESTGEPGRIQITAATRALIEGTMRCERRGEVVVKGIGKMETWFIA